MNYQIQGLSIHAEVHGTAEPALVFLHYWGGTSRTWRKVTAELEGQFKTVAYDARGWGKSDKTPASYKLADLADEALSLVKALGEESGRRRSRFRSEGDHLFRREADHPFRSQA